MAEPLLKVSGISKRFGGLQALSNVSLDADAGEIIGLIGPNGAGKTTLFSNLVGLHRPDSGSVRLQGKELVGLKPHRIAAAGMVKTFQNIALFLDSSVLDNVLTGGLMRRSVDGARELARQCLERVGISAIADKLARDLSFPERARVEVARALCTEPRVLLLDEAMAALNHVEMDEFMALLRQLREEGLTLIIVEHHMRAIMSLCQRLVVLNFGQLIATGTPTEISRNPAVIEAYLGRSAAA
jgi:branched-chain amino acid transport system ATP-binding protein